MKKKQSHLQTIKVFAKINGHDVLPDVKMPVIRKKRAVETKPRDLMEAKLRVDLLKVLRKLRYGKQVMFWRIENSLPGYKGLPDFFIVSLRKGWGGFMELKRVGGAIKKEQQEFADLCLATGINHRFIYSVQQALEIL